MDDRVFDEKTAFEWINSVEAGSLRDKDIYPQLKAWIDEVDPKSILDLGCGQGICSDKIHLAGREYTGVEPSPYLVARAQERYANKNRRFVLGNGYALPFHDNTFDAIFSVLVWHLLSDLGKAAKELSRVLKTNGHFLIITANPDAYAAWKELYSDIRLDGKRLEGELRIQNQLASRDVLYLHSMDDLIEALHAVNLKVLTTMSFRSSKKEGQDYYLSIQGQKADGPLSRCRGSCE